MEVKTETEADAKSTKEVNTRPHIPTAPEEYVTRYRRVSKKPERFGFEKTFAALMGQHQLPGTSQPDKLVQDNLNDHTTMEIIERTYMMKAMLF